MFPSSTARYCTSDHKRGQIERVLTSLVREIAETSGKSRVRVLNCLGLRAQESPARSKKAAYELNTRATNGKREVWNWLPIHTWTVEDVWARDVVPERVRTEPRTGAPSAP